MGSMRKKKQKFVALNVSLPVEQKDELLGLVGAHGYATISEYIRSLIRRELSSVKEPTIGYGSQQMSDDNLISQMNIFAKGGGTTQDDSQQKIRAALDLFERGKRIKEQQLRDEFKDASAREIQIRLADWVRNKPGAVYGDADGQPNLERLARIKANVSSR